MTGASRRTICLWGLLAAAIAAVPAAGQDLRQLLIRRSKPVAADRRIETKIEVRDGTKLAVLVTLPEGEGPWPAVLIRTPYGKESPGLAGASVDFAGMGYAQVVQDTRGRFDSEGEFGRFEHEKFDGFDTIDWIARQPWCNGKVGMFGVSAGGILANLAAMAQPPNLVCSFVVVAHGCDFRFGTYNGGVFLKDLNERWFKALGSPLAPSLHPRIAVYDDVAAGMDMRNHYHLVHIPTFNVCGWYDCFVESGIENFEGLQTHGGVGARGNQRLVVGAFGHFPLNGRLKYPPEASQPDFAALEGWFARWLKGAPSALFDEPPVRYFLMGDAMDASAPGNVWRTSDVWPPRGSEERPLWLGAHGELRDAPSEQSAVLSYEYDPRDPVPTVGGNNLFLPRGPMDQSKLSGRRDVLRFQTAPLAEPMEISGRVAAELVVSTDAEDTDFMVKLVDVYPDGYEALVLDQPMRLRYREGFDKPQRARSGEAYRLRVNLGTTALVVNKGHRLAVHVSSSNHPRFERHTNTWDPVGSYDEARTARNSVHVGGAEGSRILLPVVGAR
jgi:predicted acyl esterase